MWNRQLILQDLVLALVINTSATLLSGASLTWSTWYPFTCVAFVTNVLAQLVIPTADIAHTITKPFKNAPWQPYAHVFIENLIFVTVISLMEAFTQVGATDMFDVWRSTYLWLVGIGYITSVILYRLASRQA